jgi:hypothetical protein
MNTNQDKFIEISDDTQKFFDNILSNIHLPYSLNYQLVNATKQKQVIKIMKVPEVYSFLMKVDMVLCFNENMFEKLDDKSKEILVVQEIDKYTVDIENGRIRVNKPDLTTFSGIIKKYGWEDVSRANQLENLLESQNADQLTDQFLADV